MPIKVYIVPFTRNHITLSGDASNVFIYVTGH